MKVPNLHVFSSNTYVVMGTLTQACGAADASWNMEQSKQWAGSWIFHASPGTLRSGQIEKTYYSPCSDPLGTYQANPTGANGGADAGYATLFQSTSQFYIRVESRISVTGSRSRSRREVYVRARVTQFNPTANYTLGGWTNSPGRTVVFYEFRSGWRRVAARATGSDGFTRYVTIYAPTRRPFRATVLATPTTWDRTSTSISL